MSPDTYADRLRAFRQGLKDTGYVEGENVAIDYRWAENHIDRLSPMAAELVRRRVAVITAAGGPAAAVAAKAATTTIPIVFSTTEDPVRLGFVASLARPGGNLTGINSLIGELVAKRLELLRELVPVVTRVAVLVNPADASSAGTTLRDVEAAAGAMGCKSGLSMPAPAASSMPPSQVLCASGPTRFSSPANPFSPVGVSNWPSWRRTTRSPRYTGCVKLPKSAGC